MDPMGHVILTYDFPLGFMRKVAGCHVFMLSLFLTGRYSLWKSVLPAGAKLQPFQFHG